MESNSNPKNTGKSQSESAGKEKASYPSFSSFEGLRRGEDRASCLTRKGLAAIFEYEKREGIKNLTSQEETVLSEQLGRLQQETDDYIDRVMTYLTETPPDNSNTSVETGIGVRQVEASLKWLEKTNPDIGEQFRREVFLKQKDKYDKDMLKTKGTKSKGLWGRKVRTKFHSNSMQCSLNSQL